MTIEDFWKQQSEWSQLAFGSDLERGPVGPLKHLEKEAKEAQDNIGDLMEYVDCLFLVIDATRRAGFTWNQLLESAFIKLEINKRRKWDKSIKDEPVEHIR